MSTPPIVRLGRRVHVRHPRAADREAFLAAVRRSRQLHRPWVTAPSDDAGFDRLVRTANRPSSQRFLVCRNGDDELVGVANLSQIFLGPFRNAYLGYYTFSPHDAQGLMREGLQVTLRYAFGALDLHRVQANVQPGNERSMALVRSLGFTEEGYARRYLKIGGRWRDHVLFAILAEDLRGGVAPPSRSAP
jgi:[ribosomal protein S5]-alanine N-acetyltransferase